MLFIIIDFQGYLSALGYSGFLLRIQIGPILFVPPDHARYDQQLC
jgi:hypothetical protein